MNRFYFLLIATFLLFGFTKKEKLPAYKNAKLDIETRVADLLSRMTLEEKVMQLDMYSAGDLVIDGRVEPVRAAKALNGMSIGSVHDYYPETAVHANELQKYIVENTRLGIPALFIEEALHGYQGKKSTAFPVPIGLGSMWDVDLMQKIGKVIGAETRSVGVHMVLSPVLGIGREPRWGRVQETYGEDAYLAARNGVAIIKGMQGEDLTANNTVVAEPKHFGIHSIPTKGLNTGTVYIGEREARSHFLYVFEKAFKEAGALGAMAAYHEWDGVPAAGDPWLLKELLRDEWGFKGFVLSDLGAIAKQHNSHHTSPTAEDAILTSIRSGLDMQFYDYTHDKFQNTIIEAVKNGSLDMKDVDRAVSSVLYVKFRLGLFENPYVDPKLQAERYHCQAHQDLALESAQKSITLLQNNNNILPFGDDVKKVTIVGDMADKVLLGGYSPKEVEGTSIVDAFQDAEYEVNFVDVGVPTNTAEQIDSKYLLSENGEEGLLAEYFNNSDCAGKPVFSKVETSLARYWHNLSPEAGVVDDNFSVRWSGYIVPPIDGTYEFSLIADDIARFSINGEQLIDNWDKELKNKWTKRKIRLEKGKKYPIVLDFAEFDAYAAVFLHWKIQPEVSNKVSMFEKTVAAAKDADVVVLVLGEKEEECGEGKDRQSLELNTYSKRLLNELTSAGKPVILVLQNGRPLVLTEEHKKVDAILETWYAGELSGRATVDILTGKVNPSGKLPITFPRSEGQLPVFYNHQPSANHDYVDGTSKPLFAFGHGLNYSKFEYSDLKIMKPEIEKTENQIVTIKVKNTSDRDGTEVVQLYITDTYSSVATPVMQLRGFQRVDLKAGEEKEISFRLLPDDLALWNRKMRRVVEPGEFKVKIGAASDDIRLESKFRVK
ncbi:glycoside hydrolase family 3 N-terminal domain-containing protein [Marinifilum caeruleilacunae]|uniref:Beta-glucosidase n=1 Tax=Marinifilum caeruleilacunae TaxID=2499076 RepID=A0ABX1WUU4_9BACT|nr:glycoside hydrolase family 3 N-terminal domain-containing protein [Marinifilum caeruleilacunae]NOU59874.1 beta-glucosidase [Marinifilum caeruleilacunae]